MASYATPQDMQKRYDWRELGDLLADSNEQASALDQVTSGNQYNTTLLEMLADASGDIEAALLAAGRYQTTDLTGLTGNSLSLLKRITCEIAIAYLFERKPTYNAEKLEKFEKSKAAHLQRLADGKNVFNLPLIVAAGSPTTDGPTSLDYAVNLNLITDRCRSYPVRRLPYNR